VETILALSSSLGIGSTHIMGEKFIVDLVDGDLTEHRNQEDFIFCSHAKRIANG
jgi:hypothetical protein